MGIETHLSGPISNFIGIGRMRKNKRQRMAGLVKMVVCIVPAKIIASLTEKPVRLLGEPHPADHQPDETGRIMRNKPPLLPGVGLHATLPVNIAPAPRHPSAVGGARHHPADLFGPAVGVGQSIAAMPGSDLPFSDHGKPCASWTNFRPEDALFCAALAQYQSAQANSRIVESLPGPHPSLRSLPSASSEPNANFRASRALTICPASSPRLLHRKRRNR